MAGITLATSLVSTSHHPRRHRKGLHFPPPFQFESCLLLKAFSRPFLRLITERQLSLKRRNRDFIKTAQCMASNIFFPREKIFLNHQFSYLIIFLCTNALSVKGSGTDYSQLREYIFSWNVPIFYSFLCITSQNIFFGKWAINVHDSSPLTPFHLFQSVQSNLTFFHLDSTTYRYKCKSGVLRTRSTISYRTEFKKNKADNTYP